MKRYLIALALIFAWALIVGGMDRRAAEVTAANERSVAEKKADVKPAEQVWLRLPLECEQYIAMRGAGQKWRRKPVCADFTQRAEQ